MEHEHVRIVILDADPPGSEDVPARQLKDGIWELLKSPLYAMEVAAGDVVKVLHAEHGTFKIIKRGGNVCIQFYLTEEHANNATATAQVVEFLERELHSLGGRVDGQTLGLVTCTVPVAVGFVAIENVFSEAMDVFPGAQWQYGNIYDSSSGEAIGWWQ